MNQAGLRLYVVILSLCMTVSYASLGFSQTNSPAIAEAVVKHVMTTALSRCFSSVNGVGRISFVPPTNEEVSQIRALGKEAVAPLAKYLDLQQKDDFTQVFVVQFLMVIGGPSTLPHLKRAFASDQWEVTRAAALSGMFKVSQVEAKPYVEAALQDQSQLVRQRAQQLLALYRLKK